MALPQSKKTPKRRRSPGAFAGMTWFFEDTAMEATFRKVGKGMRLDATGRKGTKEIFSVHLDRVDDLVEGITEAISNPAMQAMLPALLQQVQGGMAGVLRPTAPRFPGPDERTQQASQVAFEARMSILNRIAKEKGAESWGGLLKPALDEAQRAAEAARAKALAEYDAAHGAGA